MTNRVLFMDVDGVLNSHERNAHNAFFGIRPDCMARLNRVIAETDPQIVVSSAWRYMVLHGAMQIHGLDYLFCTHGLRRGEGIRVMGCTPSDEEYPERGEQILRCWQAFQPRVEHWAVVDDDPMNMQLGEHQWRLVRTDGSVGMTDADADRLIRILKGHKP